MIESSCHCVIFAMIQWLDASIARCVTYPVALSGRKTEKQAPLPGSLITRIDPR